MKKLICTTLTLFSCSLFAADMPKQEFSAPVSTPQVKSERAVRLQIEIPENDAKDYGLQTSTFYTEIMTRLSLGQIQIKDDTKYPQLILRIKTIQADRAIAAFVQLAYYEDATLTRNQNAVMALTWSQATMLSCAKEDLIKEVSQVVVQMTNSYILDYQKAMAPQ